MLQKNVIRNGQSNPVRIFASYAHEDRQYLDRLRRHLTLMIRQGIVHIWSDQEIAIGGAWHKEIERNLKSADVILFLVSADFLASDYIWHEEMNTALARHKAAEAVIVPILVRYVEWEAAPFAFIQMLPRGGQPISAWPDPELAFTEVARAIRNLIADLDHAITPEPRHDIKRSTIQAASDAGSMGWDFCRSDLLLFPSEPVVPPTMKGAFLPRRGTRHSPRFIFNWGDFSPGQRDESERVRLLRYYRASLTVEDEDQWVNLSAYESNRMISDELVGTLLGHDLLEFDCNLKRLSATMLHPGFETGAKYWRVVQERVRAEDLRHQSIRLFQKVTLLPSHALIYVPKDSADARDVFGEHFNIGDFTDYVIGYVLENELSLLCDEDREALSHDFTRPGGDIFETAAKVNRIAVDIFKEMVIPVMEREIRSGSSFSRVRQMYSAMLLAAWTKREKPEEIIDLPSIDKGAHDRLNMARIAISQSQGKTSYLGSVEISGSDPIPDNRDFYAEYLELFKSGIYQTSRRQFDSSTGGFVTRVYFAGAFDAYSRVGSF